MTDYHDDVWHHPWPTTDETGPEDRRNTGVAHRHELLVDERDWEAVRDALDELGVEWTQSARTKYGLVRLMLTESYESVVFERDLLRSVRARIAEDRSPLFGRNRLMGHARLEFDDTKVGSTPKLIPSDAGTATLATGQKLAPRTAFERGGDVRVGAVDTAFFRHAYSEGSCLYHPVEPSAAYAEGELGAAAGHATFVTGLILQVAPGANVTVESVVPADGIADMVRVHDAICKLAEAGNQVINLSLGCITQDDDQPFVLKHAIDWAMARAADAGRPAPVVVAASGNNGGNKPFWPAADPRVWAVAAVMWNGEQWQVASYSGLGSWVNMAAPGDNVLSTRADFADGRVDFDSYAYWSGTSFATAVISGLIAAQLSEDDSAGLLPAVADAMLDVADAGGTGLELPVYGAREVIIKT